MPLNFIFRQPKNELEKGGRTPVAGMVHSITLVIVLVVLMPYAGMIPMPTIAAILFIVAYNMCQWRTFLQLVKNSSKERYPGSGSNFCTDCII